MVFDDFGDKGFIAKIAYYKRYALWDRCGKTGGQIIQNDNRLAGRQKLKGHVTADKPGAPCNEHCHEK
jgi:hypothetical protein